MNLLPHDEKFFDLFHQHVGILCESSALLVSGLKAGYSGICGIAKQMETLEKNADEVIHLIFRRLQTTFITPFDPEDIQTLATTLDDIIDAMEDATFRISCYRVDPIPEPVVQLGTMIDESCNALARALVALRDRKPVWDDCIEVNRLEDLADTAERNALEHLFASVQDPLTLIKHKEVYEIMEQTTDRCEDAADVIQNVAVKNT